MTKLDSVGAAMVNGRGPGWLKAESRNSAEMGPQAECCLTPAIDVVVRSVGKPACLTPAIARAPIEAKLATNDEAR
jgi:hypothetical protein